MVIIGGYTDMLRSTHALLRSVLIMKRRFCGWTHSLEPRSILGERDGRGVPVVLYRWVSAYESHLQRLATVDK